MQFGVKWKNLLAILVFVIGQNTFASYRVITDRKPLGKGWVSSWTIYSNQRVPLALGLSISGSAMKTLPEEMEMIELIPKAQHKVPPFDHFTIDWNPTGHEPTGVYTLPHFDFHYFTIPVHTRHNITCQGADELVCMKAVPASLIPTAYMATPAGVPMMGWHFVDLKAPEFNGGIFSSTFIYGYYNAQTAFLEPMVTLDFLKTKPHSVFPVRLSQNISHSGYYPKSYTVSYSPVTDTHDVVLTDLISRTSSR